MIENHLTHLFEDLKLGQAPAFDQVGTLTLHLAPFSILMTKTDDGAHISAPIAPLPLKDKDRLLLTVMEANFLGQGTGGSVIGLKEDESFLTLASTLPYEIDYASFKEAIEDFVNYLEYWKTQALAGA